MREHVVAVLALDGVVGFDMSIPCQVFGVTRLSDGTHPYLVRVCGPQRVVTATAGGVSYYEIQVPYDLEAAADADTVIVPGLAATTEVPPEVLDLLRTSGGRIVSICTGARVLAEAGLLTGRRATTHWRAAPELARRYPDVVVDAKALFTRDGRIFTSAGVAAGMDLCLHLISRDFGAATAAAAARMVVMAPTREGGQAQFMADARPLPEAGSLAETLTWIQAHAAEPLTVADIARHAALSVRTLSRRFADQLGTSPQNWLQIGRAHV